MLHPARRLRIDPLEQGHCSLHPGRSGDAAGLPADAVQVIETTDQAAVGALLRLDDCIDVIVPRGGKGLIERIMAESRIPVIKHLDGICHVYIDDHCDLDKAQRIAINAKTQRYGVCNAMETLLVARRIAPIVLPELARQLIRKGVELRGCERTCEIVAEAIPASAEDWDTEYLAPILSIRVVDDMDAALDQHPAAWLEDYSRARRFLREGRFQFGDGECLHPLRRWLQVWVGCRDRHLDRQAPCSRPVDLEGLTTLKFVVLGDGHVRG